MFVMANCTYYLHVVGAKCQYFAISPKSGPLTRNTRAQINTFETQSATVRGAEGAHMGLGPNPR